MPCTLLEPRETVTLKRGQRRLLRKQGAGLAPMRHVAAKLGMGYGAADAGIEATTEGAALLAGCSALVGMHCDEATEPIVRQALRFGKAFAVVPCCVFPRAHPNRKLRSGRAVTSHADLCEYLLELAPGSESAYLPFVGRNRVIYRRSAEPRPEWGRCLPCPRPPRSPSLQVELGLRLCTRERMAHEGAGRERHMAHILGVDVRCTLGPAFTDDVAAGRSTRPSPVDDGAGFGPTQDAPPPCRPVTIADVPDALQTMLLLLRRTALGHASAVNSCWAAGTRAVLSLPLWQRAHGDLVICRSPTMEAALDGAMLLHPEDYAGPEAGPLGGALYLRLKGRVFLAVASTLVEPGQMAMNAYQRGALRVEIAEIVQPVREPRAPTLSFVTISMELQQEMARGATRFNRNEVELELRSRLTGHALWPRLRLGVACIGHVLPSNITLMAHGAAAPPAGAAEDPQRGYLQKTMLVVHVTAIDDALDGWGVLRDATRLNVQAAPNSFMDLVDDAEWDLTGVAGL